MKRTHHILALLLGMSLAAASVCAQQKPALPKLHFENSNLQRLADMAEQDYNDPEKFYTFERDLDDWKGKPWQLMMLNYFLIVNDIINEKSDFVAEEAVKVQNVMFQKYAEGRGMSVPADIVAAAGFTEKRWKPTILSSSRGKNWQHISFQKKVPFTEPTPRATSC